MGGTVNGSLTINILLITLSDLYRTLRMHGLIGTKTYQGLSPLLVMLDLSPTLVTLDNLETMSDFGENYTGLTSKHH